MKKVLGTITAVMFTVLTLASFISPTGKASTYKIDTDKSTVKWTGKKLTSDHFGSISISEGSFAFDGKAFTAGEVKMDMNSITVEDIKDKKGQDRLAGHLKNDDFFATDKFPEAKLVITKSTAGEKGQIVIHGNLTIKEITKPISFPVTVKAEGKNAVKATGTITVDRAKYDIKFRSKSFMDPAALGDKMISDEFTLDVAILATK